jgi:hypothetical protein
MSDEAEEKVVERSEAIGGVERGEVTPSCRRKGGGVV